MWTKFKGFTLLETIVAIGVLTTALLGIYSLVAFSISRVSSVKNQNIASFLAMEGLEYIHNKRTSNALNGSDWMDGLIGSPPVCDEGQGGCYIDAFNDEIGRYSGLWLCNNYDDCPKIDFDKNSGSYYYDIESGVSDNDEDPANDTPFTRKITISEINPPAEVKVKAVVEWRERGQMRNIILEENLFDWQ